MPIKAVLHIGNNPEEAQLIGDMFKHHGAYSFILTHVECLADAEMYLAEHSVSVVLLDLDCALASGADAISRTMAAAGGASIVLLTSQRDESIAVHAMESGVQDYLIKSKFEPGELIHTLRNSMARKKLEESLLFEKNRAQVTLDCIGDAVICTDNEGNVSFLNPIAERLTGWSLMEATGRPLAESFRIMDAATGTLASDPTRNVIEQGRTTHLPLNCILTRRDGNQIFIEDSVAPIRDSSGVEAGSVLVFRDVSAAHAQAAEITHLVEHDPLTGLPNRLLLNDRLDQAIARSGRKTSTMAVLFLDLDGFKHINDSLGHPVGDLLLQSVAERLQGCIRAPDTVSRQGGDEFVVLLNDTQNAESAAMTAKRILNAIALPHDIKGRDLNVTASIGISVFPCDGVNAETLIKNADTAMYQAKAGGRRIFRFFTPEMNVRAVERQSMEEDMRRALVQDEFSLVYQPIVNIQSGVITGAEALLRWTHPTHGQIEPSVFIPAAEDSGLILQIGAWVLREACRQAKAWMDAGLQPITMSVNVSATQFRSEDFMDNLNAILDETGLRSEYLNLEVTESVLMERAKPGVPIFETIRDRGMLVSVDDFGMGYSSLSYLQKFPLDVLKIDQSFVRQISADPSETSIVSAIISIGKSLKLRVVAEGVESAQDLAFLKTQSCDEAQGFYFSRPVPADQFAKLHKKEMN
ncbi:putative bifunctional diguanylate cyclase/phosphodiesterase [Telmatobacter bradus]|uniref:putative bifunctional diguanylate cyclase/phosphodiesterase n=1 Tax=Telmatobacter bradus TaxID=474953 RepID=UPI003B43647E